MERERRRRLIVFAAALVGTLLTARLGVWQLQRAADKIAKQQAVETQGRLPAVDAAALGPASVDRRVVLRGHWLAAHTVLLDNRPMGGRPGFYVLTPLQLEGRADAVVVERGWVPRNQLDRTAVPPFATPTGTVELAGRVVKETSRVFELAPSPPGSIRQNLDHAAFARELGLPLQPVAVLETDAAADGLRRDWPAPDLGLQMHYGYAVQWFALSALILGLYVWFQLFKPSRRAR
ncbi:MAG: SURF1 family protein [Pelomonas sp.]|nr:SURF1 family protein [Roseateles sp.]